MRRKVPRGSPLAAVLVLLVLCTGPAVVRAEADEGNVYVLIESFTWKEYDDNGSRLLRESGPLFGVGASFKSVAPGGPAAFTARGEFYGGITDYDGQTQSGTPVTTETEYVGYKVEGTLGLRLFSAGELRFEPFAGLGYRWWLRDIQDTANSVGYEERWWSIYGRIGIRGDRAFSPRERFFATAGVILPFYSENKADLSAFGFGDISLEPEGSPSFFAEAGYGRDTLKVGIFYEGLRFSKSDPVTSGNYIFWQPESEADTLGINLYFTF